MTATQVVVVFIASGILDVTWARYTLMIAAKQAGSAAFWAVLITLLGAVNIVAIATDGWYTVPAALGAGIGTYFTIRHANTR